MAQAKKTKTEAPPEETAAYVAKSPIEHDGDTYDAGDEIELTEKQAEALLAVKAIERKPAKKAAAAPEGDNQGGADAGAADGKKDGANA